MAHGVTFDRVCEIALAFPGVVRDTWYGTPALKVAKKGFARLKEDNETLVLKMDIVSRDLLLRDEPESFYLTDHYRDYPYILVRLHKVRERLLTELLEDAWRMSAPPRLVRER